MGIRASIGDYSVPERKLLASAARVLFPTVRFARIFEAAGKTTFPGSLVYRIRQSNLLQETLFNFSGFPHPRTRFYFGSRKSSVTDDFGFPFLAMGPGQEIAVTIENADQLADLADKCNPLIVQDKICFERRLHLVFVNYQLAGVTRSCFPEGLCPTDAFASLFSDSMLNSFVIDVERFLRSFRLNDIAVEVGFSRYHGWQICKMERPPVIFQSCAGPVNRYHHIAALIEEGKL